MKPLPLAEVLTLRQNGGQVVDVRDAAGFAGAHLAASLNVPLDGKYATWVGTVLTTDRPIVVVADSGRESEAVMRLGRIGFDNVAGYLEGGAESLGSRDDLIRHTQRITATALAETMQADSTLTIVDVRSPQEWNAGHIDGSINIPVAHLADRQHELPRQGMVVVHCQGGYRSTIAASLLQRDGREDVFDLVGGFEAWKAANRPTAETVDAAVCGVSS